MAMLEEILQLVTSSLLFLRLPFVVWEIENIFGQLFSCAFDVRDQCAKDHSLGLTRNFPCLLHPSGKFFFRGVL